MPEDLEKIVKDCKESLGFILFAGYYDNVISPDGTRKINFRYIREHFSYEDTAKAIQALRDHFRQDIEEIRE